MAKASGYYVYQLIDPRNGQPFYIGKGKGKRLGAHEIEARAGKRSRKCDTIREIWGSGREVVSEIIREFRLEAAAFRFEKKLIGQIGLANLTNVEPGGPGQARGARAKNDEKRTEKMLGEVLARLMVGFKQNWRVEVYGRDLTAEFKRFLRSMLDKYGIERVAELVRPHGVRIETTGANNAV